MKFSVLMPVHNGISFNDLKKSVFSVINNSLKSDDFVVIVDGKLSIDKTNFLNSLVNIKKIKVFFKKKTTLSKVLNFGLKKTKYNLVIRCDADDINLKNRFEYQIKYFLKNNFDILGSYCAEKYKKKFFLKKMPNLISFKNLFFRNPLNHMTVLFNKKKILQVGGYPEILFLEDYALWLRCYINDFKIGNISKVLVHSKLDHNTFIRRKNIITIKSELYLLFFLLKTNFFFGLSFIFPVILRILIKVLPIVIFKVIYISLRKKNAL